MNATRWLLLDRMRVDVIVGILEHELDAKQPLLVSVRVELRDIELLPEADDIHHVLDYRLLRDTVLQEAHAGHTKMLETLAGRIAERLLTNAAIGSVRVTIVKPDAFADCEGVAVEVEAHG